MWISGVNGRLALCARLGAVVAGSLLLANCSAGGKVDPKYGVAASPRVISPGEPVPKGGGRYRVGKPYTVAGRVYVPEEDVNYKAEGLASFYSDDFHGRFTANGEIFDMNSITAAHPTMPLPSYARVTNLRNKKSIVVRVNDRGPYVGNRVIDLSVKTAKLLGYFGQGVTPVRVEYVGRAPIAGSDDRKLLATLREGDTPAPVPSSRPVQVAAVEPVASQPAVSQARPSKPPAERPYVQTFFDSRPMTDSRSRTAALVPSADAAETVDEVAPTTELAANSRPSPVSAYAPVRYDGRAGFSGRGLY